MLDQPPLQFSFSSHNQLVISSSSRTRQNLLQQDPALARAVFSLSSSPLEQFSAQAVFSPSSFQLEQSSARAVFRSIRLLSSVRLRRQRVLTLHQRPAALLANVGQQTGLCQLPATYLPVTTKSSFLFPQQFAEGGNPLYAFAISGYVICQGLLISPCS